MLPDWTSFLTRPVLAVTLVLVIALMAVDLFGDDARLFSGDAEVTGMLYEDVLARLGEDARGDLPAAMEPFDRLVVSPQGRFTDDTDVTVSVERVGEPPRGTTFANRRPTGWTSIVYFTQWALAAVLFAAFVVVRHCGLFPVWRDEDALLKNPQNQDLVNKKLAARRGMRRMHRVTTGLLGAIGVLAMSNYLLTALRPPRFRRAQFYAQLPPWVISYAYNTYSFENLFMNREMADQAPGLG